MTIIRYEYDCNVLLYLSFRFCEDLSPFGVQVAFNPSFTGVSLQLML
jgi:hypothetical protein